jgi:hypothetical protein
MMSRRTAISIITIMIGTAIKLVITALQKRALPGHPVYADVASSGGSTGGTFTPSESLNFSSAATAKRKEADRARIEAAATPTPAGRAI